MINLKTAESFQNEVKKYITENDCSILEAILAYGERYGLDEDYIKKYLLTAGLKEQLREECEELNLIKKDKELKFEI
jgi:hypothetical protein